MPATGTPREPVVSSFIAWGDPLNSPSSAIGQLHFDAILSEDHERTATVTEHSVEQGSNIADHVRPNVDTLALDVFVSNTPIFSNDGQVLPITLAVPQPGDSDAAGNAANRFLAGGTSALLDKGLQAIGLQKGFPSSLTAQVMQFSGEVDYVQNTFNTLTILRNTATLLSIATPRQFYSNMILEEAKMHRDPGTGTSANFSLKFRQIRIVSSRVVDAPLPSILRATPEPDQGKKDTKKADGPTDSILYHGAQKAGYKVTPTAHPVP